MGFDSISNSSSPLPPFSKDLAKKKRTNRSAKLKQSKLDVRREQWLSQVKNKGCEVDSSGRGGSPPSCMQIPHMQNRPVETSEMRSREEENDNSSIHDSDLESLLNSPVGSSLDSNASRKDHPRSSSSTSSDCCSRSLSEEEEDDGCLDDWEAVADALGISDNQQNPISEPPVKPEARIGSADTELPKRSSGVDLLKTESGGVVPISQMNSRAWRPDDALRPQSLPNLSKQCTFPMNSERHCHRAIPWAWKSTISQPSSCPICCEDLDLTDSSFLPCTCGFRLCLFCHKRILEADGRCPGCRKQYDPIHGDVGFNTGATPFKIGRSCSMISRS